MSLAAPLGLLGLLTLPVIVGLHLLRERHRKKLVSSLFLWRFLEKEVRGSRFSRIPLTWLLILHLLLAAIFSLALARPQLALALPVRDARHIILLMDVSTSMRSRDVTPDRFSQARLAAISLLNETGEGDVATVLAFGTRVQLVGDTRQINLPNLVERLTTLRAGETGQRLDMALAQAQTVIDGKLPVEFHIFTDAAFATDEFSNFLHPLQWHIVGSKGDNQAVLSISTQVLQEKKLQLFTRIANYSASSASRVLTLLIDGRPVDSTTLSIPPNSEVAQVWSVNGNPGELSVELMGGDQLMEDDRATIGILARRPVQVLLVSELTTEANTTSAVSNPVERALAAIPSVTLRKITLSDYSPVSQADLVVFHGVLPNTWPDRPIVVIQPPLDGEENALFTFRGRAEIALDAPLQTSMDESLLQGVDFGGVRWGSAFQPREIPDGFETLLAAGEYPLLVKGYVNGNPLIALFVDLERGNVTKHPAFPLMLVNIIESIRTSQVITNIHTGEPLQLPSPASLVSLQLSIAGSETPVKYAGQWPDAWVETFEPGAYHVIVEDMAGNFETYTIGVNAGDTDESNIQPRLASNLAQEQGTPRRIVKEEKINLVPWLLTVAVLLLFAEAALAWR